MDSFAVHPLIVLGVDAGDYELILRWTGEGRLPGIASVLERGAWGRTVGRDLDIEHGSWLAVLSGISKAWHGYHYYRQLVPGTYEMRLVTGRDVPVEPFWAHLAGTGRRVTIVDAPDVDPVDGLEGRQLSHWAVHNAQHEPVSRPAGLLEELTGQFGAPDRIDEQIRSSADDDRRTYRRLIERVARKGAVIRHLMRRGPAELTVAVFGETHTGGHQFWDYRPEARRPKSADPELRDGVRSIYAAVDREVGAILAEAPEANIVIVSSVGLVDQYPMGGLISAFCRKLGYQDSPERGAARVSLRPIDLARRVIPQPLLARLSRWMFDRQKRERMLADAFRTGTNWAGTTAFATPSAYASYLRVNLRGREPQGIVELDQYDGLLDRIEADLWQLQDPVSGDCPVERVDRSRRVFGADASAQLPDLIVHWKPSDYFRQRLVHPRTELTQAEPEFFRSSDHSRHGFVAMVGPGISLRGNLGDIEVLDLAPTFLSLLDIDPPPAMTGRPLWGRNPPPD